MRTRSVSRFTTLVILFSAIAAGPVALAQSTCADCGVVQSVRVSEVKGSTSGVGAVAGGVLGGVLGHQIGSGRGNTVATVAGAKVEQKKNTKSQWSVGIKMDSGQQRTFVYSSQPTVHEGERVKLIDGGRRLALVAP